MKFFIQIALLVFMFLKLNGQSDFYEQQSKDKRKVEITDSLDILINKLIDSNEPLQNHSISFPNKDKWRTGSIYTHTGDTLFGEIKNIKHQGGQTSMVLYFRENVDSKKQRYRADKLIGFSVKNKEYVSKKFSDLPPSYIEIFEKGKLSLYFTKFRQVSGSHDPMRQIDYATIDMVYEFYLESIYNPDKELIGPIPCSNKTFPDFIIKYIEDYPELAMKIKKQKYNSSHLREIVQLYNMH